MGLSTFTGGKLAELLRTVDSLREQYGAPPSLLPKASCRVSDPLEEGGLAPVREKWPVAKTAQPFRQIRARVGEMRLRQQAGQDATSCSHDTVLVIVTAKTASDVAATPPSTSLQYMPYATVVLLMNGFGRILYYGASKDEAVPEFNRVLPAHRIDDAILDRGVTYFDLRRRVLQFIAAASVVVGWNLTADLTSLGIHLPRLSVCELATHPAVRHAASEQLKRAACFEGVDAANFRPDHVLPVSIADVAKIFSSDGFDIRGDSKGEYRNLVYDGFFIAAMFAHVMQFEVQWRRTSLHRLVWPALYVGHDGSDDDDVGLDDGTAAPSLKLSSRPLQDGPFGVQMAVTQTTPIGIQEGAIFEPDSLRGTVAGPHWQKMINACRWLDLADKTAPPTFLHNMLIATSDFGQNDYYRFVGMLNVRDVARWIAFFEDLQPHYRTSGGIDDDDEMVMSVARPDQNPELSAKVDRFFAVRPVRGPSAGLAGSSTSQTELKKATVAASGASASASIGA